MAIGVGGALLVLIAVERQPMHLSVRGRLVLTNSVVTLSGLLLPFFENPIEVFLRK